VPPVAGEGGGRGAATQVTVRCPSVLCFPPVAGSALLRRRRTARGRRSSPAIRARARHSFSPPQGGEVILLARHQGLRPPRPQVASAVGPGAARRRAQHDDGRSSAAATR
jgi:hypothetical protein